MIHRHSAKDSLDMFPTPPWATRALVEHVITPTALSGSLIWEPACGKGHMAEVLGEYGEVRASDIYDYGYGEVADFMKMDAGWCDWVITNPPFNHAVEFTLKALSDARLGVAMLCRTQWLEGKKRYETLFRDHPPTIFAPFVERVPMVKGRWDPEATTPMSYSWFVWAKWHGQGFTKTVWIPPGQRKLLTKDDDVARFACTN